MMLEKMEDERFANDEIDYEYSHDELPLEDSKQQLFAGQKGSNLSQSKSQKYSYSHSYNQSYT